MFFSDNWVVSCTTLTANARMISTNARTLVAICIAVSCRKTKKQESAQSKEGGRIYRYFLVSARCEVIAKDMCEKKIKKTSRKPLRDPAEKSGNDIRSAPLYLYAPNLMGCFPAAQGRGDSHQSFTIFL